MSEWEVPRREPRYRFSVPVILHLGRAATELVTDDVSFGGMFLRTDNPPPERGLVKLTVPVPSGSALELMAMVVHVIAPGSDRVPGAGVQLYGVGGSIRDQWARYVMSMREGHNDAASQPVRAELANGREPIARRHARYAAVLAVRAKNLDELVTTYTRDISQGGTFLTTSATVASGDALFLELIHPDSGESFGLSCVVRRKVRDGVGVEFTDLDNQRREQFWEFVEPVIELGDDDVVELE